MVDIDLQTVYAERKQAEEGHRGSEELFRLLVEGILDYAIFMLSPHGHVVSWNKGAERIKVTRLVRSSASTSPASIFRKP